MRTPSVRGLLTLVLLGATISSTANATVISEGDFPTDNWIAGIVTTGVGAAAGTFAGNDPSPGSAGNVISGVPGPYLYFAHVHGGRQNGTMTARSFHIFGDYVHDPSVEAVQSISASFDAYNFQLSDISPQSDLVTIGVAVLQDDHFFFHPGSAQTLTYEVWTPLEFLQLAPADFQYSGNNPVIPTLDLSSTGATAQFGFFAFTAANFTTNGRGGVDNFELALVTVPEPARLLILAGVAAALLAGRQRRLD